MRSIKAYILLAFLFCSAVISAQTYNMPGGTVNTCSGTFYDSGGSGSNYAANLNITTTFCSSSGNCIRVTFSAFNTESGYDFLRIYDGPSTASALLGTYSGTSNPGTFTSTTGCLTFRFTSDNGTQRAGWTAAISCVACPPPAYNMPGGTINACSATFYDGGGTGNYGASQNVTTTFCSTSGNCVSAAFSSFATENGYDYLYVYDGTSFASPIGVYTGNTSPGTVTSTSGCLTFRFTSDGGDQRAGWAAAISCATCTTGPTPSPQNCGAGAITVCSDQSFAGNSSGSGNISDLIGTNEGCLTDEEHQSSWYYFSPSAGGNVQLSISPSNTSDDYDFAIWGPMTTVACPPMSAPIRCSYAEGGGATGLVSGAGDNSENANGNRWVESINAAAGDVFILVIDNYTASSQPFLLDWTLTGGAMLNCTPLPVELLSFNAKCIKGNVNINWATASQTNNDYFTIERTPDGVNFESIGTVSGAGTSNENLQYSFTDPSPPAGTSYYRLKQTDYNGNSAYFDLASVVCDVRAELNIYPNPNEGEFIVEGAEQNQELVVTDMFGQIVLRTNVAEEKTKISLSHLDKGIYFISLSSYGESIVKKIIFH